MSQLHTSLLFFYTETSLHAGSGAGVGAIDLPLQRERMSELPQVQGSGIKGALRELFRAPNGNAEILRDELELFGPRPPEPNIRPAEDEDKTQAHEHAGALAVTDARLLLLPVRSARGGWAWITSPLILQRLARDLACTKEGSSGPPEWTKLAPGSEEAYIASTDAAISRDDYLIVEDSAYQTKVDTRVGALAAFLTKGLPSAPVYRPVRERLASQLAVISDEEMCYWARHATEVVTRVRIAPDTGTVQKGALWTEEALPSESLLWSVAMISDGRIPDGRGQERRGANALNECFSTKLSKQGRIFLGGDRTVGRGLVALGRIGA